MLLFALGLDLVSAGLVLVPIYVLLDRVFFRSWKKTAAYLVFSFYLVAVYHLVGLPCITYINPGLNLTLIPFLDMIAAPRATVLNVALFLPLGFLLPLLWKHFRTMKNALFFGFGMSLTIELLQILVGRATDINDLITNTLGTCLGFLLAKPLLKAVPGGEGHRSLFLICSIVFAVMFFVDPYIFTFFWDLILY